MKAAEFLRAIDWVEVLAVLWRAFTGVMPEVSTRVLDGLDAVLTKAYP